MRRRNDCSARSSRLKDETTDERSRRVDRRAEQDHLPPGGSLIEARRETSAAALDRRGSGPGPTFAIVAYGIDRGQIDGVDVSGLTWC